jgi:hypothetical protein
MMPFTFTEYSTKRQNLTDKNKRKYVKFRRSLARAGENVLLFMNSGIERIKLWITEIEPNGGATGAS